MWSPSSTNHSSTDMTPSTVIAVKTMSLLIAPPRGAPRLDSALPQTARKSGIHRRPWREQDEN
jgi:hypothetical protein